MENYKGITKIIMTCTLILTREEILETLKTCIVKINNKLYKVEEYILLECLINKQYGGVELKLEKLED